MLMLTFYVSAINNSTGGHNRSHVSSTDSLEGSPRGTARARPTSFSPPPGARRQRPDPGAWIVEQPGENAGTSGGSSVWELGLDIWPVEDRPPRMQDPRYRYRNFFFHLRLGHAIIRKF